MHLPLNSQDANKMILDTIFTKISDDCPVQYIDIPIKVRNIEIIVGSKVNEIQRLKIKEEVEKYSPNAIVSNSKTVW